MASDITYEEGHKPVGSPQTPIDSHHSCIFVGGKMFPTDCDDYHGICSGITTTECRITKKEYVVDTADLQWGDLRGKKADS